MKRLIGIVLIIIGIVTYFFFKNYNGNVLPYPTLWFLLGIILVIIGIRFFITSDSKHDQELKNSFQAEIERLKQYGENINVDFNDCEIISSNYYKEVPKSSDYRVQAWDSIYDSSRTVENIEINQSRITYQDESLSEKYIFISPIINKDKITLSFILNKQKKTTIYVDKKDKNTYYFDLEFLNQ